MNLMNIKGWQEEAECRKHDAGMWDVDESASRADETAKFAVAEEICLNCPVMITCRKTATEEDLHWTMRGGELPQAYLHPVGRPAASTCKRGHDTTDPDSRDASRRCRKCVEEKRMNPKAFEGKCYSGHDVTGPNARDAHGECRVCKRERAKKLRKNKKLGISKPEGQCFRGHDTSLPGAKNKHGRCVQCVKWRNLNRRMTVPKPPPVTECPKGHDVTGSDARTVTGLCRECDRDRKRASRERKQELTKSDQLLRETLKRAGAQTPPDMVCYT